MLPVQFEIEITSKCNARCPGCSRTVDGKTHPNLNIIEISLDEFKNIFVPKVIRQRHFGFSGVFGDPGMAKDLLPICEYLLEHGAERVYIDTNGGMQTKLFWSSLGDLSAFYNKKLTVNFNVDGYESTNHIYRVNVNWNKLVENMTAYSNTGGRAVWQYIEFNHNSADIEDAKQLAQQLGFYFQLRRSTRNITPWISTVKTKNKTTIHKISTTKQHSKSQQQIQIIDKIKNLQTVKFNDINCRLIHQRHAYISHDQKLWPCCWYGDMYSNNILEAEGYNKLRELEQKYCIDWNCLKNNSIDKIVKHDYYKQVLQQSWNPKHDLHISKCIVHCGDHGSRGNTEYATAT